MDINKRLKINDQNTQNNSKRKAKFDNTQNYFGKFIKNIELYEKYLKLVDNYEIGKEEELVHIKK